MEPVLVNGTLMKQQTPFDRLCEAYGITSSFEDIWGERHPVAKKVRRALLKAMGVDAHDEAAIEASLRHYERQQWQRVLPPVQVVSANGEPIRIPLLLPLAPAAGHGAESLAWTISYEDGRQQSGQFNAASLPLLERHRIARRTWLRYSLELHVEAPTGYHQLSLLGENGELGRMSLIVVPPRCYQPAALTDGGRLWGPAVQLYSLRSEHNWGIGDFTDLRQLIGFAADNGAGIVGISPLHALFPDKPEHASPYSPSSRLFLNTLFIDVEAIADYPECRKAQNRVHSSTFQARLRALRASELVDYKGVAAAKGELFEMLFRHFCDHHLAQKTERAEAFSRFQAEKGEPLFRHALFEALQEHFDGDETTNRGWMEWPEAYRDPASREVSAFAESSRQRVLFYQYLQWQAHLQLQAAGQRSYELGLGVGLYQDLAVSIDPGGAEAWANQPLYALDAQIGSPPDEFNLKGQEWGLPPQIPARLHEMAYAPFIATLRQNMRSTGALRIDHVMALMRLYWIPAGGSAFHGGYVHYPLHDLLGILALESQRNRCLIIGEDLGTVPAEIREALKPLGVLSYRLFYLERDARGEFAPPDAFPAQALVAITTHDLPTLAGYWQGNDLTLRSELQLFPSDSLREEQLIRRAEDRARLLLALEHEELLPEQISSNPLTVPEMTLELACAIHRYLARSTAQVMTVQMEDVFGQLQQVNLPGTTGQHPNWRRKLELNLEHWAEDPRVRRFVETLREERGSAVQPPPMASGQTLRDGAAIPRATYRLQFNRDFTFAMAAEHVPFLAALGISHCYASPLLMARPGSSHGYDIVEHHRLNPELGSTEEFEHFVNVLQQHGMGLILDMVPNHMGVMGNDNPWWLEMLENGPAAASARFFDIDWSPLKATLRGKVLLPVLGDHYGTVLEKGELTLGFDPGQGHFDIRYYEHRFPIDPGTYSTLLGHHLPQLGERLGEQDPGVLEFASLTTAFANLPLRTESDEERLAERRRDSALHKQHLARLYRENADIACYLDEVVQAYNDTAGQAADATLLHRLLEEQPYRLAYWRVASDEINYRRFFDINDLASLRMEEPEVYEATHALVLELIAGGKVQGLRIDHPDGLYNPRHYFQRLQQSVVAERSHAGNGGDGMPLYVVVEKILAAHERLPADWPVHGTTGYDFAALCNDLFVDASSEKALTRSYRVFSGEWDSVEEMRYQSKKLIMRVALSSELNVLAMQLSRIAEADTHTRDYTLNSLRSALAEVVACFPVYRTYVSDEGAAEKDADFVRWAVGVAKKRSQAADTSVFDFLLEVLLTTIKEGKSPSYQEQVLAFAMKFQQLSAPVMAKGVEDTAFYRYNRLVSLNEVGGEPDRFGITPAQFHRANQLRQQNWPHAMLAGSTHDSKRSEDVRARINVISEFPDEWRTLINRLARINRAKKRMVDGEPAPSRNDEYLLYQTLVGTWPDGPDGIVEQQTLDAYRERIDAYMNKAIKEAKRHTSWINPNADYEEAMRQFIAALLGKLEGNAFLAAFIPFARKCARFGFYNSLAQTQLRLTVPGVPDVFQGNELAALNLVDPDNRRPVDYAHSKRLFEELNAQTQEVDAWPERLRSLVMDNDNSQAKLFLIWKLLGVRSEHPELFRDGDYLPLACEGEKAEQLCAFARQWKKQQIVSVTPRLFARLMGGHDGAPLGSEVWGDSVIQLPPASGGKHTYRNLFSNEAVAVIACNGKKCFRAAELFSRFPVAVLVRD